mgnify:CR=1 FL=1
MTTFTGCCGAMGKLLAVPHAKGFSVIPVIDSDTGERWLVLEARAVEVNDVEELSKPLPAGRRPVSIAITTQLPLLFCPSCGTELAGVIERQPAAFDLAAGPRR